MADKEPKPKHGSPSIKSWYLEDDLSDNGQQKKEDIQKACEQLNLPFTRETAMVILYGDNQVLPERVLPIWFHDLK